jgi:hypothetical protein
MEGECAAHSVFDNDTASSKRYAIRFRAQTGTACTRTAHPACIRDGPIVPLRRPMRYCGASAVLARMGRREAARIA